MKLRLAHYRQLLAYLEDRERDNWYYGPKAEFNKRHKELKEWLTKKVEDE